MTEVLHRSLAQAEAVPQATSRRANARPFIGATMAAMMPFLSMNGVSPATRDAAIDFGNTLTAGHIPAAPSRPMAPAAKANATATATAQATVRPTAPKGPTLG